MTTESDQPEVRIAQAATELEQELAEQDSTYREDIQKQLASELRTRLRAALKYNIVNFILKSPVASSYTAVTGEDFKNLVLGMVPEIVDEVRRELCQ
jgi:hypothetical protein